MTSPRPSPPVRPRAGLAHPVTPSSPASPSSPLTPLGPASPSQPSEISSWGEWLSPRRHTDPAQFAGRHRRRQAKEADQAARQAFARRQLERARATRQDERASLFGVLAVVLVFGLIALLGGVF